MIRGLMLAEYMLPNDEREQDRLGWSAGIFGKISLMANNQISSIILSG